MAQENDSFVRLCEELREARQRFENADDGGRQGACYALNAVYEFIDSFDGPRREGLADPLIHLANAILSLDDGTTAPILKPNKDPHSRPKTHIWHMMQVSAVVTLRQLKEETGMKQKEAAAKVAEVFNKAKIGPSRGPGNKCTGKTILNWWDEIDAGIHAGRATTPIAREFEATMVRQKIGAALPLAEREKQLLDALGQILRQFRAQDEAR